VLLTVATLTAVFPLACATRGGQGRHAGRSDASLATTEAGGSSVRDSARPESLSTAESFPGREAPAFTENYLIYPVRWGRAEDLAQTLEPILQARYGTEARVVPHIESNRLFIYIPSGRPDPTGTRAGQGTGPTGGRAAGRTSGRRGAGASPPAGTGAPPTR
jgi:hypothetical protein